MPKTPPPKLDHGTQVAKDLGIERSPKWPGVEKEHLKAEPRCVACAAGQSPGAGLQVHHQFPFHFAILLGRPDLELDQRNLITLCEDEKGKPGQNHHLLIGHLDSFEAANLDVRPDAQTTFHGWASDKIKASAIWKQKVVNRLKPWAQMTDADKKNLRALMDQKLPKTP